MQRNFVIKAQKQLKRIAALTTGSLMLGATAIGAVAAQDLGDYPSPFIGDDGALNGLVVVGADAASSDVVGAAELVSTLTQAAVTTTPGAGGTTTVTGGKSEDVNLGDTLTADFGTTGLDDDDLSGFQDTSIDFDDSTFNVHDEVILGTNFNVSTSLTSSDDDYEENVAIELPKGALGYYYVFDEVINLSKATTDEPAELSFLGRMIEITSVAVNDHNSFSAQIGQEYFLGIGDSVVATGGAGITRTVTLLDVSSAATCTISVDIDGVTEVVSTTAETVNGIKVEADECFYSDEKADRSASLIVGEFTTKSYDDGDEFIEQDEDDPDWVWDIGNLNDSDTVGGTNCTLGASNGPCLGVINDFVRDDWDDGPIVPGESYCLPWDYACVAFDSLTVNDYLDITVDIDTSLDLDSADTGGLTWGTSEDAIVIESNKEDTLVLDQSAFSGANGQAASGFTADVSTDKIYLLNSSQEMTSFNNTHGVAGTDGILINYTKIEVFYEDSENDPQYAGNITMNITGGEFAFVDFRDTTGTSDIELQLRAENYNSTTLPSTAAVIFQNENANTVNKDIVSNWTMSQDGFSHLGATANTEEAGELQYGGTNLGTKDENHRTHYGIIVYDPESNGASDKVELSVPGDEVEATVIISGPETVTTATGQVVSVVSVKGTDVAKLDTEVANPASQNLILVGGPAVNRLTAQALGLDYPTFGAASTIPENRGMLRLISGAFGGSNVALVVAGWTAQDTRDASDVLKNYASYSSQLAGKTQVEVEGSTVQ